MPTKIDIKDPICIYKYNSEFSADLGDCISCIHNLKRTCPYEIYDDTIIIFKTKRKR